MFICRKVAFGISVQNTRNGYQPKLKFICSILLELIQMFAFVINHGSGNFQFVPDHILEVCDMIANRKKGEGSQFIRSGWTSWFSSTIQARLIDKKFVPDAHFMFRMSKWKNIFFLSVHE